jgi:hypothetical protein
MTESLKKTVEHLPEIMSRNAQSMMQRMVAAMQQTIATDRRLENSSYCALLLKMSADDLVREFDLAIKESMAVVKRDAGKPGISAQGWGLSIEPLEAETTTSATDFLSSTALFEKLCAKASSHGIQGLAAFNKELFLASVNEAFTKARIAPAEVNKIKAFAGPALNDELVKLYGKLDSLRCDDSAA